MYSPDGKLLRQWGKPDESGHEQNPDPGTFSRITDLAIGADGTVYVLDPASGVQAFSPTGDFKWQTGQQKFGMFSPSGIGVSADGNLLIADTGASRVLKLSATTGSPLGELRGVDAGSFTKLNQPLDAAASGGTVYAVDLSNRIVRFDASGNIVSEWGVNIGADNGGARIALDTDGFLYISDPSHSRWGMMDVATGEVQYFGARGANAGQFNSPAGIAAGPDDRVYVLDSRNGVQVFARPASK